LAIVSDERLERYEREKPSSPKRGLIYEDIDQKQAAFGDSQTAITLDPYLQQAYRNRLK